MEIIKTVQYAGEGNTAVIVRRVLTDGAMGVCTAWQHMAALDTKGMPVDSSVPSHEHQYIAWVLVSMILTPVEEGIDR